MSQLLVDTPVSDPSGDLLSLAPDAKRLARLVGSVELPFTLGVYGAWGEGKTTFARLIVHYLREQMPWSTARYIEFSAWPYVTADAIWRALVGQIARSVYDIRAEPELAKAGAQAAKRPSRLRGFLNSIAIQFTEPPADPNEEAFLNLMTRVDRHSGLAVRSSATSNSGDRAIASSILAETLSALVPSLRLLNPLAMKSPEAEADAAVDSIEELRDDLREMFAKKKNTKFVVVVDDLDRCHPEVGLDVLETIKIFFAESMGSSAQCLFIVAVDETLIGKGLSARLNLRPYEERQQNEEARLYLEKIIQIGVPVPAIDTAKAHRIIAAWSPGWACASDVIVAGLGTNLRRIKQQCSILTYRLEGSRKRDEEVYESLLAKLVQINAIHPDFVILLKEHSILTGSYLEAALLECEQHLNGAPSRCSEQLLERLQDTNLRALVSRPPAFTAFEGSVTRVLASIADIQPDGGGLAKTADPVMQYILDAVRNQADTTTVERLHLDYFQRLARFRRFVSLLNWLRAQAAEVGYLETIRSVDAWFDALDESPLGAKPPPAVPEDVAQDVNAEVARGGVEHLRAAPRLAQVPQQHMASLPEPQSIAAGLTSGTFQAENVLEARWAIQALDAARRIGSPIDTPVKLRLEVAREIADRRRFAKMQVLELGWPDVYGRVCASGGQQRLKLIEQSVLQPELDLKLPAFWQNLRADENLETFLRISPYFHEIYAPELSKGLKEAQPVPTGSLESESPEPTGDTTGVTDYVSVVLKASGTYEKNGPDLQKILLELARPAHENQTTEALLPYARILDAASNLIQSSGGSTSRDVRGWAFEGGLNSPSALGELLWEQLFLNTGLGLTLVESLSSDQPVRLLIECEGDASLIPWECLSIPKLKLFDARTRRFSIVRKSARNEPVSIRSIRGRLRILVVHSVPDEVPLPSADQEIEVLERTLSGAQQSGIAQIQTLKMATAESVQQRLRSFQPHIFHFIGHGVVQNGEGNLVLVGDEGRPQLLGAEQVGVMLQDEHILLAVLNACDAGSGGGTGESVASVLADIGVPAAIAPTRMILDDAALWFSRAFYSALLDGLSVEPALSESRKALSIQGWDWSAYALYAPDGPALGNIRIESRRSDRDSSGDPIP